MKKIFALTLACIAVVALSACSKKATPTPTPLVTPTSAQKTPQPTQKKIKLFSVMVEGVEDVSEFNQDYYSDLSEKEVTLAVSGTNYSCRGVAFKDVLSQLGASAYTSVTVIGVDGTKQVFDKATITDSGTFFAIEVNGVSNDCPMLFAASKGSKYTIKDVAQIIVK